MVNAPTYLTLALVVCLLGLPAAAVNFQSPEPVESGVTDTFFNRNVRVATDRAGNWVAVYELLDQTGSFQYDIVAITSDDNGDTWSEPEFVNSNHGDIRDDTVPQIATDGDGKWVCVWKGAHDSSGNVGIFTALSTDNGATWSDRVELDFTSFDPFNSNVANPHVASDGAGNWIMVWQTQQPSVPPSMGVDLPVSIAFSVSTDGASWSTKQKLNSAGPSNHTPFIASDRGGTWICTWVSTFDRGLQGQGDPDIAFSKSTNNGQTWSPQAVPNAQFDTDTKL